MYKIISKDYLTDNIVSMDILAPKVASSFKIGQFVIVKADEKGERIPLTICDVNNDLGTVNIVFQMVGYSTKKMSAYQVGDCFADFVGPLGNPSDLTRKKADQLQDMRIVFVAGGVGIAPIYPQVKYLSERNIDCDVIIGTRSKSTLILEEKIKKICKNVYISTDDGSYGFHGNAGKLLEYLIDKKGKTYTHSVVIGPLIMMKYTAMTTKKYNIPTTVSLNSMMVDGTGMCGACRVKVGDIIKFTCVDGPEFDGHEVDFDLAINRISSYEKKEQDRLLAGDEDTKGSLRCSCKREEQNV